MKEVQKKETESACDLVQPDNKPDEEEGLGDLSFFTTITGFVHPRQKYISTNVPDTMKIKSNNISC